MLILSISNSSWCGDRGKRWENYLPLKVGYKWIYKENDGELTEKIIGKEKIGDIECYVHVRFRRESQVYKSYNTSDRRGIRVHKEGGYTYSEPQLYLKFPFRKGDEWERENIDSTILKFKNEGEEVVKVPAGKFCCFKISAEDENGNIRIFYFAYNIGLVKYEQGNNILELKESDMGNGIKIGGKN